MPLPLPFPTLLAASQAIQAKHISPLELTQICLRRIEAIDPHINAFITITAESALGEARTATDEIVHGRHRGPLHGIPLAIKDLFDVRGVATTAGSPLLKENVAQADAFAIRQLREAGAIFLGKLNMHEWALGVTGVNPHFGPSRNPWNTACITGGSSSGSGAALAAGLCYGSLGSDTGGSIRIPSSLCGVVGLKPTYGRVSVRGVIPLSWSLDHAGPLGHCVDDVAALFKVINVYDASDPYSIRNADRGMGSVNSEFRTPHSTLRIGVPDDYFFTDLHPETETAYRAAIKTLGEIGFELHDVSLPGFEVSEKASAKILLAEAAAYHQEHIQEHAAQIGEDVLTRFRWGLEVTGVEYAFARCTQVEWQHKMMQLFESIDALVLPATPFAATRIDESDPVALSKGNLTRFTRMFNLTGNPAIVLPCGRTTDGLPIGLQIVGPHWQEEKILRIATAYEEARGEFGIVDC
ncbi:MAG: Asp-tRNA(Asn)/Glu-tRNA(Gln) amidotransferase subunit GatA [Chloroflexi bacterium]|nr:Asp-tRNA(Asn)/Glu-tRNA(Gln) amidotransferase subunit GatA [Chloroflexota bacterium]